MHIEVSTFQNKASGLRWNYRVHLRLPAATQRCLNPSLSLCVDSNINEHSHTALLCLCSFPDES